jgi:hypothetical protein
LKSVQKKFKNSLTHDIGFVILRSHTETQISHMRTKTLLLTAALTAAGVATSMAQVYSVNMVGYINHTIPDGFSMISNQLNNSPDNKVTTLFPAPPEGTQVYKYNATDDTFTYLEYVDGAWGGDNLDLTVGPGEGFWINPPSSFAHTFVGEVQLASSVSLLSGFNQAGSALPQSLPLTGAPNDNNPAAAVGLGYPVGEGDQVYQYNPVDDTFIFNEFVDGAWGGDGGGEPPTIAIAQGFWINAAAARTWSRNYVIGVD